MAGLKFGWMSSVPQPNRIGCRLNRDGRPMQPLDSHLLSALVFVAHSLGEWKLMVQVMNGGGVSSPRLSFEDKAMLAKSIERLRDASLHLGMAVAHRVAKDAFNSCIPLLAPQRPFRANELQQLSTMCDGLIRTFVVELEARSTFVVAQDWAALLQSPISRFGGDVLRAFPSTEEDVREAGKCLALGSNTASVFHCMRIMEAALVQLGKSLSLDPATNWNNALNQIEKEIRGRSLATHGAEWKKNEAFFAEAVTHFRVVKNAWRNHTMHGRETFDADRARIVFDSTVAFMRHLSERISERDDD